MKVQVFFYKWENKSTYILHDYPLFQRQESILKKRLQAFLAELLKFGTIKGFKNFAMYLRGREELVISVLNEPKVCCAIVTILSSC